LIPAARPDDFTVGELDVFTRALWEYVATHDPDAEPLIALTLSEERVKSIQKKIKSQRERRVLLGEAKGFIVESPAEPKA
jgi:hypothetical protein